ncbi:MAG: DUF5719 family protein [Acidimicrobiales bacterium]
MSPTRHQEPRRWLALVSVALVLFGGAALADSAVSSPPSGPPLTPGAIVGSSGAESSAWYCTGQSTAGNLAVGSIDLTNTGASAAAGSVTTVSNTGDTSAIPVTVPARGQLVTGPPASSGTWISRTVVLSTGGVAVTQSIHGSSGWGQAPCVSGTSQQWYFPSGQTAGSNDLYVVLFNPTSTTDVVDLSFVTPSGVLHPISFQGIVLQPEQIQVENIGTYVQDQSSVATTVASRTGRVVASETQVFTGSSSGLAVLPGSPRPERQWSIPQSQEVAGGSSSIDIFNPGSTTEVVTVRCRLASGPLPPFQAHVLPDATWTLATSKQTRIPKATGAGGGYATVIDASGGPGVVVGRTVVAPGSAAAPQAGLSTAVDALSAASPSLQWVVPSPGSAASPAVAGATPDTLALSNPGGPTVDYVVSVMSAAGLRVLTRGRLPTSTFISLSGPVLASAGLHPLLVSATGPVAIGENVGPSGGYGVVTMPGIPIAADP